jgi:hypothetical protein
MMPHGSKHQTDVPSKMAACDQRKDGHALFNGLEVLNSKVQHVGSARLLFAPSTIQRQDHRSVHQSDFLLL